MPHNTIIDIGANHGEFSLEVARRNPLNRVIAVEPLPALADALRGAADSEGLSNHDVRTVAVGSAPGRKRFNVSTMADNGISSLLDLDVASIAADRYWQGREDLEFSAEIFVEVQTLELIINELDVSRIDFVKIDAQGLDLDVLTSAGGALPLVMAGMLEVPTTGHQRLYGGETQDLRSALNLLAETGFDVYAIKPNDPACNEVNVFFARPGIDPQVLERDLCLTDLGIYDGKNYWANPVSTVEGLAEAEHLLAAAPSLRLANGSLESEVSRLTHALAAADRQTEATSRRIRSLAAARSAVEREHAILKSRNEELAGIINALLAQIDALRVGNELRLDSELARESETDD